MSDAPYDYWCNVSALQNLTSEQRRFLSIPSKVSYFVVLTEKREYNFCFIQLKSNGSYDQCTRYAVDWQEILSSNESVLAPNTSWPVEKCQEGWEYNTSEIFSSIVTDVSNKLH